MTTPRRILERHGLRPLKRYGQSFLMDRNIMSRIVESVDIGPLDQVVEIGAGVGIMTGMLADRAGRVIALDADRRMIDVLEEEMAGRSNVTILKQDVLSYDFSSVPPAAGSGIRVVGNIPYNISSQILLRLIHFRNFVSTAVLMFQKELAERIVAEPGTPAYGTLSVLVAMYMSASKVISVSPRCFFPRPNVSSIVLKFETRDRPLFELRDHEHFQNILRAAFAKRRKTLMNSLMDNPFILISQESASRALKELGIDPMRRGETLTPEEFARLANVIRPEGNV
ncbi:MAG: 16S rRNA (adenine(1518)-N(6)/adenine(1519)-N(6))-dimethyltransferase RsmA [Syntrophales bacterium]|nr:16S rRNA (adenine(1518)-N(6)/adenine(1519)-N(6))-dimethyltransferase RsmA [Syntrophales bacterium]